MSTEELTQEITIRTRFQVFLFAMTLVFFNILFFAIRHDGNVILIGLSVVGLLVIYISIRKEQKRLDELIEILSDEVLSEQKDDEA